MATPAPVKPITGKTVLIGMMMFFAVIFAVNGAFVYFALDSWPKLVSQKSYQEGLAYNTTLDAAQAQSERGWTSTMDFDGTLLLVSLADNSRNPLEALDVVALVRRPVNDSADINVPLQASQNQLGYYSGALSLPLSGRWYVMIEASSNNVVEYRMEYEIMVKP